MADERERHLEAGEAMADDLVRFAVESEAARDQEAPRKEGVAEAACIPAVRPLVVPKCRDASEVVDLPEPTSAAVVRSVSEAACAGKVVTTRTCPLRPPVLPSSGTAGRTSLRTSSLRHSCARDCNLLL